MTPFANQDIQSAFDAFPEPQRSCLLTVRQIIFATAKELGLETPSETLKWGQPSYSVKGGTPVRLGLTKTGDYAIFTHCQTTVMATMQNVLSDQIRFDGNRAALFSPAQEPPKPPVQMIIQCAMTYHKR